MLDDESNVPLLPLTYQSCDNVKITETQEGHGHGHKHGHNHMGFAAAEYEHKDIGDGGLRAVVFGFSDGIVTNLCLILGVYVASRDIEHRTVILTGIAGLLAGACSMAIGEWISVKFQREANEAQLELERFHLTEYPKDEENHFRRILKQNGLSEYACEIITKDLEKTSLSQRVKWHAMLELKIDVEELGGSPWIAATSSFAGFSIGAFIPLLPWICTRASTVAFYITLALSIICIIFLGIISGILYNFSTDRQLWVVARQVVLVAIACAVVIGVNNGISRFIAP